ncbi:MAG: 3-isopropylmalate dehydratase large subunit [archaeon]
MDNGQTIVEKIFSEKSGRMAFAGDTVIANVDKIMSHDATTSLAIKSFNELKGFKIRAEKVVFVFDHVVPAASVQAANMQKEIMGFAEKHAILDIFYGKGICHHLLIDEGIALPNTLIAGADSHTCTFGAVSSLGIGMGSTDIAVSWATGKNWFMVPETIKAEMNGKVGKDIVSKDIALEIIRILGANGAAYKSVEYSGNAVADMAISDRITIANMSVECGAKIGLFPSDSITKKFFEEKGKNVGEMKADENAKYESLFEINLNELERLVACPHEPKNVKAVSEAKGIKLDQIVIGTCTNGRLEDLELAAKILKGKSVHKNARLIVVPSTVQEYQKAMGEGLMDIFLNAGAIVCNAGCGPCLGRHSGVLGDKEVCLSTQNRNFCGRMGSPNSEIYLGSPITAALSAIEGELC